MAKHWTWNLRSEAHVAEVEVWFTQVALYTYDSFLSAHRGHWALRLFRSLMYRLKSGELLVLANVFTAVGLEALEQTWWITLSQLLQKFRTSVIATGQTYINHITWIVWEQECFLFPGCDSQNL